MKCKSLILGPAAALLVAPSGALAADAMMKDDMGPVTACEAFGSGWFFSPGTETCLKFDGDMRVQYESTSTDGVADDAQGWDWRGRVNIRSASSTEAGDLMTRVRINASSGVAAGADPFKPVDENDATVVRVDWATIYLGGLRMGRQDGFWYNDAYGYYNARNDGIYGGESGMLVDYTFSFSGVKATAGISESGGDPDFYVGANWSGGGGLHVGFVWVRDNDGGSDAADAESGDAWRIVGEYDMSFVAPGASIRGWYNSDSGETGFVGGKQWGVTGKVALGDDLTLFAGYSQAEDETDRPDVPEVPAVGTAITDTVRGQIVSGTPEDRSHFTIGLAWTPVPGLLVQPEYTLTDYDMSDVAATITGGSNTRQVQHVRPDSDAFGVRIVRSF